jgi:hypothetical protein
MFAGANTSLAQTGLADSLFVSVATQNTVRLYTTTPSAHSELYNGREYNEYRQIKDEHPYFLLDWTEGEIGYSGKTFENVPLLYDLSTDEIITEHNSGGKISLHRDRVSYFIIKNHRYEWMQDKGLPSGFYNVIYSGRTKLLVRREKKKQEKISGTVIDVSFDERVRYFLLKENKVISFSNKKSLIKALAGDDAGVKKRLSTASVDFKKDKEKSMISLVNMYDKSAADQ